MADLIYYKPASVRIAPEDLPFHVRPDNGAGMHCAACDRGPDGATGVVGRVNEGAFGGAVDRAVWNQFPDSDLWVGFDPQDPVKPADLARKTQFNGHWIELEDLNKWLVPVARMVTGATPLPCRLKWDGDTWSHGNVLPRYAELFEGACRLWDAFFASVEGDAPESVSFDEECNSAAEALSLNYRLGPVEISLLGLFSTRTEAEVVKALVDFPALEALKKKLEVEETSGRPGDLD